MWLIVNKWVLAAFSVPLDFTALILAKRLASEHWPELRGFPEQFLIIPAIILAVIGSVITESLVDSFAERQARKAEKDRNGLYENLIMTPGILERLLLVATFWSLIYTVLAVVFPHICGCEIPSFLLFILSGILALVGSVILYPLFEGME